MEITRLQMMWLTTRGDRDMSDIVVDKGQMFVIMSDKHVDVLVPIPSDIGIKRLYNFYFKGNNGFAVVVDGRK